MVMQKKQILTYKKEVSVDNTPQKSIQIYASFCSVVCCIVFLVVFFAVSSLRNNMFKSSKGSILAIEYHTMIALVYICISTAKRVVNVGKSSISPK